MPSPSYLHISKAADLPTPSQRRLYRLFEILPGSLVWLTFILALVLSRYTPIGVALFIIAFDIYWLVRTAYLVFFLSSSYKRMRRNLATDWRKKIAALEPKRFQINVPSSNALYHLVIIPIYKEDKHILSRTLKGLARNARHNKDQFWIALAIEERVGEKAFNMAKELKRQFLNQFGQILITRHPHNLPGEIAGKGANATWAGRKAKELLVDPKHIAYERIIVTTIDADTVVGPAYFDLLTYTYLTTPQPTKTSYQPIPFFHNNIWSAPALARVLALSSTFWYMILQERPERQGTFASHSMPFKALIDVGFWQTNVVSEDSRIFYQCLLAYNGNYRVTPLYYPVSMDANVAKTFWRTVRNQYLQQRRWAWGVEHFPYLAYAFIKNKKMRLREKFHHLFVTIETFYSWSTASLLIFFLGWLPITMGGEAFNTSVLSFNLPRITRLLMLIAMIGIIHIAFLTINLVPPRTPKTSEEKNIRPRHRAKDIILLSLQWLLLPISLNVFGAFPAIDAQTRLMLGRYLGFWPTEKEYGANSKKKA